ncbi:putative repeat protein (TIGR03843 family) [Sediminihabitans luteus]|uniref:Putative repeat protein (TIGR03843 family) n=1 Tax=Sediminihabitans luteus TaxID=1138585 RepID=A0A2M9CC94_9CELL|nr:SCO1664 family protein [Sediminihabitans luteus]PJJ68653.1 putative repeat protein (TIGR03843 family) [Sediminihabitans luteus]GII99993.1 phosphatidylinositol kinase [Sediminihabitans luteus]
MNEPPVDLGTDPLEVVGRIRTASNATFVGTVGGVSVVYKPVAGENPLWDFPDGTLAQREVAAYLVSEATGWDVVPLTWLRDGPAGPGMVQLWQDEDRTSSPVDLVPSHAVDDGWHAVLQGTDADGAPVTVVHEDTPALRRVAVLDVVLNNADRKGGHVLPMPDGRRLGVDHGVTFHVEPKLRTVLWGWVGEPLDPDELDGVARVRASLDGDLGARLRELLTADEVRALGARCDRLLAERRFPDHEGDMPAVPWPPF